MKEFNVTPYINKLKEQRTFWLISVLLIASWCYIFLDFFPNRDGNIGHDYSYFLPRLLAGYYWFSENGLFNTPYFTPAFCGGDLFYANPQNLYYSLPQLLTFFINPLSAVSATFVTFALIGYFGFYYLLRDTFNCHKWAALLGAALFLFNSFYAYRIIIGHLSFHGFMLIPLIAFFLLKRESNTNWVKSKHSYSIAAALLISYILYSGGIAILLPITVTILVIVLMYASIHQLNALHWKRFLTTGILIITFSASKLMTIIYVIQNFARDGYPLPGTDSFITALWIPFKSLFIAAENNSNLLTNSVWELERHAFEYGITIIPLILLSIWAVLLIAEKIKRRQKTILYKRYILFIIIILATPILLNFYTPEWNHFLKNTPIIKNSSSLFRWYMIYIPFLLILSGLAFNQLDPDKKSTQIVASLLIIFVVTYNANTDNEFYHLQKYNPQIVIQNHNFISTQESIPQIQYIGYGYYDKSGKEARGNEIFTNGISKLDCYQPLFGYRHEFLPQKEKIKAGSIGEVIEDNYNMKNPACYIYPDANQCQPGDNFVKNQTTDLIKFTAYMPYDYALPLPQMLANMLSLISIIISFFFLIIYNSRRFLTNITYEQ